MRSSSIAGYASSFHDELVSSVRGGPEANSKGGDEPTGFLRTLLVFCWISLSCGCIPSIPEYPGGVSVLLHLLLHAFSWVCLLPRCYMVLVRRRYMNA